MIGQLLAVLITVLTLGLIAAFGHDTWLHATGRHPADEADAIDAYIDEAVARLESWAAHPSNQP